MDSTQYKVVLNSANTFDFQTLKITIAELEKKGEVLIADEIRRILSENEIEKPIHHNEKDNPQVSFYIVDLKDTEIEVITSIFADLEVFNLGPDYEITSAASLYASILDKWNSI